MRSFIHIYAFAVCFTTLMCFVIALGLGLYDIVQISAPDFTLEWAQLYRSNDAFVQYYPRHKDLPEGELTVIRKRALRDALQAERRSAFQSLVFVAIIAAIDMAVFGVHWRIARTELVTSG